MCVHKLHLDINVDISEQNSTLYKVLFPVLAL